jgi:ABC-type branched-subunit amino acid transport system ATPase component
VEQRIDEIVEMFARFGAMRDRNAADFSGGERKLLAIGEVLMTRPSL